MSKAFTRESDDAPERPVAPRPVSVLPPGTRHRLTPDGARRLESELAQLRQTNPASHRIATLQRVLQEAEIVPPPTPPHLDVRFGAFVTVKDSAGLEETFRLVGVEEADPARDWISWVSPLARGLMNRRAGEKIRLNLPAGPRDLEIVSLHYLPADPT